MNQESILFINPDYHNSFILRDKFRDLGWKTEIIAAENHSKRLLYQNDVIFFKRNPSRKFLSRLKGLFLEINFFFKIARQYKFHFYYADITFFTNSFIDRLINRLTKKKDFSLFLFLCKIFRIKILLIPSGCRDYETQHNFSKLEDGNVCNNCAWKDWECNDSRNMKRFNLMNNYLDVLLGVDSNESSQFKSTHIKYKSLDLNLWHPNLIIPQEHLLDRKEDELLILHSYFDEDRGKDKKNIKGSAHVIKAIEDLKNEGYKIKYLYIQDKHLKEMKYYQVQADIVVEQLIYGWWGSTGVETMSLGKPVICYLRESWIKNFHNYFPEIKSLPIVEANVFNIKDVLRNLITDQVYRNKVSSNSREFAEKFFDVNKNIFPLISLLKSIK